MTIKLDRDYPGAPGTARRSSVANALEDAIATAMTRDVPDGQCAIYDDGLDDEKHGSTLAYVFRHAKTDRLVIEYQHRHGPTVDAVRAAQRKHRCVVVTLDEAAEV